MLQDGNCPYTVFALGEPGKIIPEEKNLSPAAAGDSALAGLFARKGIEGALALSSLKSGRTIVHDEERANLRFAAASAFRILNTKIDSPAV